MAKKTGLGRGLDSLISGGAARKEPEKKKASRKSSGNKAKKNHKKADHRTKSSPGPKAEAAKKEPILEGTQPFLSQTPFPVASANALGLVEIAINQIQPNPHQPRKDFDEVSLKELAESIRAEGLLQPVVVRQVNEQYQLIAGERRWRACRILKLKSIPARVIQATESSTAILSLIENLQRENLNPIEEAMGYASLLKDFDLTQERVAERVGRSRASVANSLRLLQLHREIQGYIVKGILSVGHAKVLLGLENADNRLLLARQTVERGWSVRELERQLDRLREHEPRRSSRRSIPPSEDAAIKDLQKKLSSNFSTRVLLKHTPKKGKIIIEYFGNDDLQRIIEQMGLR